MESVEQLDLMGRGIDYAREGKDTYTSALLLLALEEAPEITLLGLERLTRESSIEETLDRILSDLRTSPKSTDSLNLAGALLVGMGRGEEAMKLLDEACEEAPADSSVLRTRAALLVKLGRSDEAAVSYERALESDSGKAGQWLMDTMNFYSQALENGCSSIGVTDVEVPGSAKYTLDCDSARALLEHLRSIRDKYPFSIGDEFESAVVEGKERTPAAQKADNFARLLEIYQIEEIRDVTRYLYSFNFMIEPLVHAHDSLVHCFREPVTTSLEMDVDLEGSHEGLFIEVVTGLEPGEAVESLKCFFEGWWCEVDSSIRDCLGVGLKALN